MCTEMALWSLIPKVNSLIMEALVFEKSTKSVTLESVPIPTILNADDVQIQVRNCGVCGTDVHIFHGDIANVGDR